jgi:hypothetical protein
MLPFHTQSFRTPDTGQQQYFYVSRRIDVLISVRRGKQITNFLIAQKALKFIIFLEFTDACANILFEITPLNGKRE